MYIHIELIELMSASSSVKALRRFFAIRGPAKQLRSDCGTNFINALKGSEAYIWKWYFCGRAPSHPRMCLGFNHPHASNMGSSWESMRGTAKRILDMESRPSWTNYSHSWDSKYADGWGHCHNKLQATDSSIFRFWGPFDPHTAHASYTESWSNSNCSWGFIRR